MIRENGSISDKMTTIQLQSYYSEQIPTEKNTTVMKNQNCHLLE